MLSLISKAKRFLNQKKKKKWCRARRQPESLSYHSVSSVRALFRILKGKKKKKNHVIHNMVISRRFLCNSLSTPLADIVLYGFFLSDFSSRFSKCIRWEMFPHPYKECFVLLFNRCGISQSTPLQGPTSTLAVVPFSNRCGTPNPPPSGLVPLLAHRLVSTPLRGSASSLVHHPMFGSDTICNSQSPPLTDIVLFGLFLLGFPQGF